MSDTTPRVALPLLAAAQAQKHVTHNEALLELDALVAPVILDRGLSTPPSSPSDGDTYLVKATGTAAWTGQDGKLAYAIDGGWRFYAPFEGLTAYVADEAKLIFYNGSAWVDFVSAVPLQNAPMLGINATADATNKLTVASAAVLFNNIGAGVQAKLNKNASGDTASLLYQTNFSGHAEIGLTGDDNFHFKVSPDGSTFYEALILNRNTGSLLLKHVDISSATTLGATHLGRLVRADASGGAFNIALPVSADADDWVIVRKKDSSANRVTLKDNAGNDVAWLTSQHDEAMFAFWDGVWNPVRWNIAPLHQVFTASGTWTKPPLMSRIELFLAGGGGGGGSGRRGAAGSARAGGVGGVAGNILVAKLAAADLGSSCSVTVGAGGAGAVAQTVNDSNGNSGGNGGNTSWTNLAGTLSARGGSGGAGGTAAAATGGSNSGLTAFYGFSQAGSSSVTAAGGSASTSSSGAGSGGAGGGISTADAAQSGGLGGGGSLLCGANLAGGSAGTAGGNGGNGADTSQNSSGALTIVQPGGSGGGGGAGSASAAAGQGGNGGAPCGGGGGGGASANGNNSGAGGDGGRGEARVTTFF